jgi:uncharacterized protein with GYD domain
VNNATRDTFNFPRDNSLCFGNIKTFYLTTGDFDMIIVVEVPDDITLAKLVLSIGSRGTVRTKTLRAYTESEYRQIIDAVPRPVTE